MGQKVNPIGFRLGVNKTWSSKWYVDPKEYAETLHEDLQLRKALMKCPEVQGAEISNVEISRKPQRVTVLISTSRPGVIIGAKGANIEKICAQLQKVSTKKVQVKIKSLEHAEKDAQLIAQSVAKQIVGRIAYKRAMKNAVTKATAAGVQGIKIRVSGRLGGAEISRSEWVKEGRIPLHTLRSDIDYGFAVANTTFGAIGVKVWIYNGEIYDRVKKDDAGALVKKASEFAVDDAAETK
jgi:ribosomal protein S3, bacterial type